MRDITLGVRIEIFFTQNFFICFFYGIFWKFNSSIYCLLFKQCIFFLSEEFEEKFISQ
jgi:hypothetical protein